MDYRSLEKLEAQIRNKALIYALIINGILIAAFLYYGGVFDKKNAPTQETSQPIEQTVQTHPGKDRV